MFSNQELTQFYSQMRMYVQSGITPDNAFRDMERHTQRKERKKLYGNMRERMEQGASLSDTFDAVAANTLPVVDRRLIAMAEESGNLDATLARLEQDTIRRTERKKRFLGKMAYPTLLLYGAIFLPKLYLIFTADQGVNAYLWAISPAFALTAAIVLGWIFLPRIASSQAVQERLGEFGVHAPFARAVVRKMAWERYSRSMALSLRSGIPILRGMEISSLAMNSATLQREIKDAISHIMRGNPYSESMVEHTTLPEVAVNPLVTGERSGNLDEQHEKVSNLLGEQADTMLRRTIDVVAGVVYAGVAVYVASVVISFYRDYFGMLSGIAS